MTRQSRSDALTTRLPQPPQVFANRSQCLYLHIVIDVADFGPAAEIVNGVYGFDAVTANCVEFWFRRFRPGILDVEDAPRIGRPVIENVSKITEIIEIDRYVSRRSIAQELKIDHKTVLSHLRKVGFKKKLHVWMPHQLAPKKRWIEFPSAIPWPNVMKSTHFLNGW
ncbi:histone-lysine N-methyltransferase SETMAR [Trichonephila clavipes]|nr:histone-lysine N-methyltransferase SETMAR [Trichonephila clavipes]